MGKDRQEILVFTDHKGRIIKDSDVDLTWVDGYGDENEAPLKVENKDDHGYKEDQEEVHPEQEDQTITQQPVKIELYPLKEAPIRILQVPDNIAPHTVQDMEPEHPKEIPGVHKSSRVKFQTKQDYIHIITGSKYAVAVDQLEDHRALHLDAQMFFVKIQ